VTVTLVEQPYRGAGRRSPAPRNHLDAAWVAVLEHVTGNELNGLPLIVGGRSLGARVACRTAETVAAVARALELLEDGVPVVIDPVMVAESGAVLLDDAARQAMVDELLPLAAVITPNLPEARVLTGDGEGDAEQLARALHALGPAAVVVTGGHRDEATDVFFDGEELHAIPGERHADGAAHGSGCTHSSALAAHLALGFTPLEAARAARRIAGEAVRDGLRGIGAGAGPVDVFDLTTAARRRGFGAQNRSPAGRRVT
jgi:hydroxymethylpyrimidine/phosphomethylpyrimidine kinase